MKKTILITGASSGIGKVTTMYFAENGWNVAATMRNPEKGGKEYEKLSNVKTYALDVTKDEQIKSCVADVIKDFGRIDVLLNNAGYGAIGIFEKSTKEEIERQLAVNVVGLMEMTRAVLPHMRVKKSGTIINVSSVGGRMTIPLYSVYHASKFAVEGFSEALQAEVKPFNINIKIIEPGAIKTDFFGRSLGLFEEKGFEVYDKYQKRILESMKKFESQAAPGEVVAKAIYKAATSSYGRIRYAVPFQAKAFLFLHGLLPYRVWAWATDKMFR